MEASKFKGDLYGVKRELEEERRKRKEAEEKLGKVRRDSR
jgi:hypothetical protein